ncbi:hypothetical protein C0L75_16270 [Clostridium perfringens]|nr:hypothetical protein [Clostridium perfringens]
MALKREKLSAYVVPELKEYIVSESEKMGMSQGAFLTMVIQSYRQQSKSISTLEQLLEQIKAQSNLEDTH